MSAARYYLALPQHATGVWTVCTHMGDECTAITDHVTDDYGGMAASDWHSRYVHFGIQGLHEVDDDAMRAYWHESMLPKPPTPPKRTVVVAPDAARELARIQAKLERWELQHLRALAAEQAERIEQLEQQLTAADDSAEFWRDAHHSLADHLDGDTDDGRCIGLTKDGALLVVRTGGAA